MGARARQLHADFGLPTNPQISLTLCYALAFGGELDASVLEIETVIAEAVNIGSAADFDRAEALFIKAYLRSAQGLPNGTEVAEEALAIGRRNRQPSVDLSGPFGARHELGRQ